MFDTSDSNGKSGSYSFGQAAPEYAQPTPVSAPPGLYNMLMIITTVLHREAGGSLSWNERCFLEQIISLLKIIAHLVFRKDFPKLFSMYHNLIDEWVIWVRDL